MKVVIVHDWLTGFRGGERVLEAICELFPDAKLYTLIHKKNSTSSVIENRDIISSFLNVIPNIEKKYRFFLPIFPFAISTLSIPRDVDLVISSSHCVAKGIRVPSGAKHICYIHSPMRYIYDQFDAYFGREVFLKKIVGYLIRPYLRTWDYIANSRVDCFISNSKFVAKRVELFYHRDSSVIYPFVDLKDFKQGRSENAEEGDFFLMVTALAPNKRIDIAIEAFKKIPSKLKIVGVGQMENELLQCSYSNIEFLGSLPRKEVVSLMRQAKGFIFPGIEDFGITPLESLAAGTPVIAFKGGGVLETLNRDVAVFFEEATPESLMKAVKGYDKSSFCRNKLFDQAEKFSKERFQNSLSALVSDLLKSRKDL